MTQPTNRRLVTEAKLATDLAAIDAADVGAATPADLTDGLATKQDTATLPAAMDAVAADTSSAFSVRQRAALVPFWAPNEAVAAGAVRMTALGLTITRNSSGTTRATYDATEDGLWTVTSGITPGITAGQIPVWDGDSWEPQTPTAVAAADVPFTPTGSVTATDVQTAVDQVAANMLSPWRVGIDMFAPPTTKVGTWVPTAQGVLYGGSLDNTSSALNDEWVADVVLPAGTWELCVTHGRQPSYGQPEVSIDDGAGTYVAVGVIEGYAAATEVNVQTVLSGIVIDAPIRRHLRFRLSNKNAASTSYRIRLQGAHFRRTA